MLAAHADVVHVLAAGCEVSEGWMDRAVAHFRDPRVAAVVPLVLDGQTNELLCRGIDLLPGGIRRLHVSEPPVATEPSANAIWGPALFAAFYRMTAVKAVGGLPTAVGDEFADADLACSLSQAGYLAAWEPNCWVSADTTLVNKRSGRLRRAWHAQRLFGRSRPAFSWTRSFPALGCGRRPRVFLGPAESARIGQIVARAIAFCDLGHYHRHRLTSQVAIETLATAAPGANTGASTDPTDPPRRADPVGSSAKVH